MLTCFILVFLLLACNPHHLTCTPIRHHHRRILHQPFLPLDTIPPTRPPSPPPQSPQPKFPFSSSPPNNQPFFPSSPSPPFPPPPPPPSSSSSSTVTFPANISSLSIPQTPHQKPISPKLVALAVILSLFSIAFIVSAILLRYYRRRCNFSNNKASRLDDYYKVRGGVSTTSSEFLHLGTFVDSRGIDGDEVDSSSVPAVGSSTFGKFDSPELLPLPPLSRQISRQNYRNSELGSSGEDDEDEFYSPRGSSGGKESSEGNSSSSWRVFEAVGKENFVSRSSNSSNSSYPTSNTASPIRSISSSSSPQPSLNPKSFKSKPANSVPNFSHAPPPRPPPPPRPQTRPMTPSHPKRTPSSPFPPTSPPEIDLNENPHSSERISDVSGQNQPAFAPPPPLPPPPPPPPPKFLENANAPTQIKEPTISRPPVLITPSRPVVFQNPIPVSPAELPQNLESLERNEDTPKLKLKPLHWDKVRASSDRAMVWDRLKSSSFQLNEEMIETLFVVKGTNMAPKESTWQPVFPQTNQENSVLDPKKSQNIAILLRALNVTIEEVCEALLEGNSDTLGTELLESLLKMAPTKEEERKLKDYKDNSPFKLGPAERFLKAVLDIPFAFKRVDAMLYIANFDSEVEYLKKSFETLEAACEELRNSRMFMKLLEAVLKTGNRMNVGTNRGDAHAFKLDTLLKLVDVRGTDGKTTLLHFVVQEIIKAEGSRQSSSNESPIATKTQQSNFPNDLEFRKLGLQIVAGLGGELTNVKKAAAMDSDVLSSDVSKLAKGTSNVEEVLRLNAIMGSNDRSQRFSALMNNFLKKAGEEIIKIQAQESVALSLVKEITEYFHGNSSKEEAHPFRIFMVVRDFLSILDRVCKEVGKINERTIFSSGRQFPVPVNPMQHSVFPNFLAQQRCSSSDDENSS